MATPPQTPQIYGGKTMGGIPKNTATTANKSVANLVKRKNPPTPNSEEAAQQELTTALRSPTTPEPGLLFDSDHSGVEPLGGPAPGVSTAATKISKQVAQRKLPGSNKDSKRLPARKLLQVNPSGPQRPPKRLQERKLLPTAAQSGLASFTSMAQNSASSPQPNDSRVERLMVEPRLPLRSTQLQPVGSTQAAHFGDLNRSGDIGTQTIAQPSDRALGKRRAVAQNYEMPSGISGLAANDNPFDDPLASDEDDDLFFEIEELQMPNTGRYRAYMPPMRDPFAPEPSMSRPAEPGVSKWPQSTSAPLRPIHAPFVKAVKSWGSQWVNDVQGKPRVVETNENLEFDDTSEIPQWLKETGHLIAAHLRQLFKQIAVVTPPLLRRFGAWLLKWIKRFFDAKPVLKGISNCDFWMQVHSTRWHSLRNSWSLTNEAIILHLSFLLFTAVIGIFVMSAALADVRSLIPKKPNP
jgi:hypothetical protein